MSSYKDFASQHIEDIGVSSGSSITQASFNSVTQSGVVTITHDADTTSSRIVQVVEFESGEGNYILSNMNTDYTILHTSSTQTKVTKESVGTENIKVNVIV